MILLFHPESVVSFFSCAAARSYTDQLGRNFVGAEEAAAERRLPFLTSKFIPVRGTTAHHAFLGCVRPPYGCRVTTSMPEEAEMILRFDQGRADAIKPIDSF
uniref:Uncharacterized protein n=1 Tax=Sphaerodactylus townsendi TaxID=933632 RepID=A0ACB8EWW0_9SAUR